MFADISANMMTLRKAARRPAARVRAPGAGRRSRMPARLLRLYLGLAGFGVSLALMVRAGWALTPWHRGLRGDHRPDDPPAASAADRHDRTVTTEPVTTGAPSHD